MYVLSGKFKLSFSISVVSHHRKMEGYAAAAKHRTALSTITNTFHSTSKKEDLKMKMTLTKKTIKRSTSNITHSMEGYAAAYEELSGSTDSCNEEGMIHSFSSTK